MVKIEHGEGRLLSIDTDKKTLRFQQILSFRYTGESPPKEWEHPYILKLTDQEFFDLVGKSVEYVLSDDTVVSLSAQS